MVEAAGYQKVGPGPIAAIRQMDGPAGSNDTLSTKRLANSRLLSAVDGMLSGSSTIARRGAGTFEQPPKWPDEAPRRNWSQIAGVL
jgi:hypothetical protein